MGDFWIKKKITLRTIILVIFPFPHFIHHWIGLSTSCTNAITIEKGKTISLRGTLLMSGPLQIKSGSVRYCIKASSIWFKNFELQKLSVFFLRSYLFIHERHRERGRDTEGEAGSL